MTKLTGLVIACLFALSAGALTLKEKKKMEAWTKQLTDATASPARHFKRTCGTDMPVTLDENMVTPFMEANASAAAYCEGARSTMAGMCEDATSKKAITDKIKAVKCTLGKDKELVIKFNGTTLEMSVGLHASNIDHKVKEWLENNL